MSTSLPITQTAASPSCGASMKTPSNEVVQRWEVNCSGEPSQGRTPVTLSYGMIVRPQPRDRDRRHGHAALLGQLRDARHDLLVLRAHGVELLLRDDVRLAAARGRVPDRAREAPRGKRAVRRERHAKLAAHGDHLVLVLAVEEVVLALHGREGRPAVRGSRHLQIVELVGVHRARAERAHLARAHELVEGGERLLDGSGRVKAMDDIEVQVVGAQPAQRVVNLAHDRRAGEAAVVVEDLARQDHLVARHSQLAQGAPDVLLARAVCVAVGGVDEVDAGIRRRRDHGARLVVAHGPRARRSGHAKAHAAQTEARDLEARFSQLNAAHVRHVAPSFSPAALCPFYPGSPARYAFSNV